MENGNWKMENGKWKMENGNWKRVWKRLNMEKRYGKDLEKD